MELTTLVCEMLWLWATMGAEVRYRCTWSDRETSRLMDLTGVAAAIASPPGKVDAGDKMIQEWIEPIRKIYRESTRFVLSTTHVRGTKFVVPDERLSSYGIKTEIAQTSKSRTTQILVGSTLDIQNHQLINYRQ